MTNQVHVKKGDTVVIISGRDKDKRGKVLEVSPKEGKIIIGIVVVLLTAGMFFYLTGIGAVDSKSNKDVSVTIPQGSGAAAIVKILDEKGLVRNTLCAKIHARIGGYDSLQANTYVFSKSMSLPEMMTTVSPFLT